MEYRQLGKWGVRVSAVSLGSWLTYGGSVAEETAAECIHSAYEAGVNFFDTANVYMRGRSEEVVGRALARYPRDSYVLATKVFFPMGDGPNDRGLSRKHIHEQIRHSLRRLGTDYVDIYQCHRYDDATPLEETCAAMHDLVVSGRALYWGVSEWTGEQITAAVELCEERGWHGPVSNQPQYSALWRKIERDGALAATQRHGLGNVVWSPLAMGVLTGKYLPGAAPPPGSRAATEDAWFMSAYMEDDVLEAVQRSLKIAQAADVPIAQLALEWCLRTEGVSSVIIGASTPEQLTDTLQAGGCSIPADVITAYDAELAPVAGRISRTLGVAR
jgi:aryl-alcohol dehydrogenase-like predicted oxidoreductase